MGRCLRSCYASLVGDVESIAEHADLSGDRSRGDMRRSFDGLSALVMDVLAQDPLSGHLFVFFNRLGDKIKILYYDGQGLCQWYKRLEQGRFRIPTSESEGVELSPQELGLLLDGLDIGLAKKIPKRRIRAVM